jgi:uncharacterized protein
MDTKDHAHKGATMARTILNSLGSFSEDEIEMICNAIHNHSDKDFRHSSFTDVLIDADVMQHCLYNLLFDVSIHEKDRFESLKEEFGL